MTIVLNITSIETKAANRYGFSEYVSASTILPSLDDYKPHLIAGSNSYLVNESIQLGAASFNKNASNIFFAMNYDARFGVATKASASPSSIYMGSVYKATKTKSYALSVTKN